MVSFLFIFNTLTHTLHSHAAHIDSEDGININLGPGEHKWYFIKSEDVPQVFHAATIHGVNTKVKTTFVPPKSWLKREKIEVIKIIQKPGDIVWVPAGHMHWTKAKVNQLSLCSYSYILQRNNVMSLAVGIIEPHNIATYWKVQDFMETLYVSYEPLHTMAWGIAANNLIPFEEEYAASLVEIGRHLQEDYKETFAAFQWIKVIVIKLVLFLLYLFCRTTNWMNNTSQQLIGTLCWMKTLGKVFPSLVGKVTHYYHLHWFADFVL